MAETKPKQVRKILNLDTMIEAHDDGLWRELATGGRLKLLHRPFERGQEFLRLQEAYRKEHNLAPNAPIPEEIGATHQEALLRAAIIDFDGSSFILNGAPVADRDADGKLHEENLNKVFARLVSIPETRGAAFVALNTIAAEFTQSEEIEEKNSSTPSPTS